MTEVIKFRLSGLGASFTRPHFNNIISTYSHIHKISVLGILGAILGIEKQNHVRGEFPPFYKELNDIKLAIVPTDSNFFSKRFTITDTTCFSNDGSTFIGQYDTLINPSWDIYILKNDNPHYEKLKHSLLNKEAHFTPYMGRNHWFADIEDVCVLNGEFISNSEVISGLFKADDIETIENDDFDFECEEDISFEEYMPVSFQSKSFIQYVEEKLAMTNRKVLNSKVALLECDDKALYLF